MLLFLIIQSDSGPRDQFLHGLGNFLKRKTFAVLAGQFRITRNFFKTSFIEENRRYIVAQYRKFIFFSYRVNPGKYGQGGKYGQMTYNSHVQEHRSVTKKCFISTFYSVDSALLHPYTT